MRALSVLVLSTLLIAAEPDQQLLDSTANDTTAQLLDSTTTKSNSVTSGWLIPLSVIFATAGVFIFLFSARTKS